MKTQKIIKVGNSLAVTLPASYVKEGNLRVGDEVVIETAPIYQTMLVKPKKSANQAQLSPEFFEWLNKFTKKNSVMLKKLAKTP
jgi:antitoxin component of MazEF toxin-antitoxin module